MKQLSNKGQSTTLGGCLLIRSGLSSTNGSAQLVNVKSHLSHKRPKNNFIIGSFTLFFTNKKQSLKILFFSRWKRKWKWNGILLPKLWEKIVLVIGKIFEVGGWSPRICKYFEITRTICSNSERSQQFLVREYFLNLFL